MQKSGLDTVRGACPLFDRWVEALERPEPDGSRVNPCESQTVGR